MPGRKILLIVLALGAGALAAAAAPAPVVLDVRDFGATGDGVTDDYDAMRAAVEALCASPAGSRLVYPPGTYRIDRYRVFRGPSPNGVDDVVYRNCRGVTISGYGATIDVKGDFHQSADVFADGFWYSYVKQVTPFFMVDSSDFVIEGFEMTGNVQQMTRDPRALEDSCAGITTRRCSRYLLRDLDIHHFSVDSVQLGFLDFDDAFVTDKDVRIENVRGHHDGRVGLVLGHVRRAWIVDSTFEAAGDTEGEFGSFVPQAGTDIEPDFTVADGVDVGTGEVYFINSTFRANKGPDLLASFPERVDTVVVYGTSIVSAPDGYSAYAMVVGAKTAVVERSTIDLRNGKSVLLGTWDMGSPASIAGITYASNFFRLSANGGLVSEGSAPYDFTNNDVSVEAPAADGSVLELSGLRSVTGNRFFVGAAGATGHSAQVAVRTNGTASVLRNEYRTDRTVSGQAFATSYGNGSVVQGELFPNSPYFTPAGAPQWSPASPYPVAASVAADGVAPVITNVAAVNLTATTLISWLTDEAADSQVEYGRTAAYGNVAQLTGLSRYHPVFLSGLELGATMHFRVRSTDAAGNTSFSSDATFTVPATRPPVVTTAPATSVTADGATLNGQVHPGGFSVTTAFEYGLDESYGSTVAAQALSGGTTQPVTASVPLTCGTTYHYRATVTSITGTLFGQDETFTTAPCPCTIFALTPSSANATASAGSQTVTVTGLPAGCAGGSWSASSPQPWASVTPANGDGSGSTTVAWTQNVSASPRSAGITIAGQTFALAQEGAVACNYSIAPPSVTTAGSAGSGVIDVTGGPAGCAGTWSASGGSQFLSLIGTPTGSGAGAWEVAYSYPAYPGETGTRQDEIVFEGAFPSGGIFTLTQRGTNSLSKARTDMDGDGKSDIFWYHAATGETYLWLMDGYSPRVVLPVGQTADLRWKIAGTADFDANGTADVLWRHAVSGENYLWTMAGSTIMSAGTINWTTDPDWKIAGTGDVNGDGHADIVWRHAVSGDNYVYLMDGFDIVTGTTLPRIADARWKIAGMGDLNGDGRSDLVWRHATTGETYAWLLDGYAVLSMGVIATVPDAAWTIAGVSDFDGDGKADLFWRHAATGANYLYRMDGRSILAAGPINDVTDLNWKVASVADFDGNGKADVLWRHAVSGEGYVYLMNGFTIVTGTPVPGVPDLQWTIVR